MQIIRNLSSGMIDLIYPPSCHLCEAALSDTFDRFCSDCKADFAATDSLRCYTCAAPIGPYTLSSKGCLICRDRNFRFSRTICLGRYDGRLREGILRLKRSSSEHLAYALGKYLADQRHIQLADERADAVVPVPLHWIRRFTRGYNQSETIAEAVAKQLGLPCRPSWLRRVRHTGRQIGKSDTARQENLRGAFAAGRSKQLIDKSILLVDDVMTTGSTADEAARALLKAGASRVTLVTLAHSRG